LQPLVLNAVQRHIHARLEAQRAACGMVRALILKARQPGVSTYVGARFYWKVTHGRGLRAFILTHRDQATANLFAMAKRFLPLTTRRQPPLSAQPPPPLSQLSPAWTRKSSAPSAPS